MCKKIIIMLVLISCIGICTGCGRNTGENDDERLSIVCTTFPQYDWAKNLIQGNEDRFELTLIMDNGSDLHNYQPTTEDMVKIGACDILIYVGGNSDAWVDDILQEKTNQNMHVIRMMETLGDKVREEESVEGMEQEAHEKHGDQDEVELDEHVWLSLTNAAVIVDAVADTLQQADPEYADLYARNAENYKNELEQLDGDYRELVDNASRHTLLFGDRFPFRYLVDDYGLDYYAAFNGCSAETEASFETIAFLAGKLDELDIPVVLVIENSDQSVAQAIINNTKSRDQKILKLDSLQSVTAADVQEGVSYLSIMKNNLDVLGEALN